jgi:hypothetical protein
MRGEGSNRLPAVAGDRPARRPAQARALGAALREPAANRVGDEAASETKTMDGTAHALGPQHVRRGQLQLTLEVTSECAWEDPGQDSIEPHVSP